MTDFDRDHWRKLYRTEPFDQRAWSMMTRGIRDYLIRWADDHGVLLSASADPVRDIVEGIGPHDSERGQVGDSVSTLFSDGYLIADEIGKKGGDTLTGQPGDMGGTEGGTSSATSEGHTVYMVRIRNFGPAQTNRSKAAEKKALQRARATARQSFSGGTTSGQTGDVNRDNEGTDRGTNSGDKSGTDVPLRREEKRREREKQTGGQPGDTTTDSDDNSPAPSLAPSAETRTPRPKPDHVTAFEAAFTSASDPETETIARVLEFWRKQSRKPHDGKSLSYSTKVAMSAAYRAEPATFEARAKAAMLHVLRGNDAWVRDNGQRIQHIWDQSCPERFDDYASRGAQLLAKNRQQGAKSGRSRVSGPEGGSGAVQ